ncbi:MAG: ImmA/IrrE family metallo-endopeptidase [Bradymonadaceae bacterium]
MDVPFMEEGEIRAAAREMRRAAFGSEPAYPIDVEALIFDHLYEEHGLALYNDKLLGREDEQDVLGVTYPLENEIHVDRRLAEQGHRGRYRFTVAHELGHWRLHRPLFLEQNGAEAENGDARIVTFERDVVESKETYRPEEWQANCFAIWLLLGDPALDEQFRRRFGEPPFEVGEGFPKEADEPMRSVSRALAATPKEGLEPLHAHFDLSVEATAIALEERGYVEGPLGD